MALINKLKAIADAIRAKTGKSAEMSLDDMVDEIGDIEGITVANGLNEDFRAFVEESSPNLSFTTYSSSGRKIAKSLANSNINDIDMPNLTQINAPIPINEKIARKIENYPLTQIAAESSLVGSCDKLELMQSLVAPASFIRKLTCPILAMPYVTLSSDIAVNQGGSASQRKIFWASEHPSRTGPYDGYINNVDILILTKTSNIVALRGTNSSYFNPNIKVFVPASMLDSYRSATNWSTIADQIFAIEDSEIILKGIFKELDLRYNWISEELTLLQRLQKQKVIQSWQITYNELITIANDLADNGANSEYYDYKDALIISEGLPITDNINLFITDTFKYKDVNDELIPLSGWLTQKKYISQKDSTIGLTTFWGQQQISRTSTVNGFGESDLYHKLNDSDGSLFTMLPTSLTNDLVEWKIDNGHTALLAPLSEKEVFGVEYFSDSSYNIYDRLTLFANNPNNIAGSDYWWLRSPYSSDSNYFCFVNTNGVRDFYQKGGSFGLAPAIALGKKGVNNA